MNDGYVGFGAGHFSDCVCDCGGRGVDGEYARGDAHGFYWTASECETGGACFYNFGKGGLALHRQAGGEKERAFAVR
jgi:hypothetical protein